MVDVSANSWLHHTSLSSMQQTCQVRSMHGHSANMQPRGATNVQLLHALYSTGTLLRFYSVTCLCAARHLAGRSSFNLNVTRQHGAKPYHYLHLRGTDGANENSSSSCDVCPMQQTESWLCYQETGRASLAPCHLGSCYVG